jgi:hypothetical protein
MSKDFIGFRVTPDVKERLEAEAEKEMRPLSHLIRDRVLKPVEDAPIPHEPPHEKAFKAKVREAVENEEPYEVKIEPGTSRPDHETYETWVKQETIRLKARMSTRRAEAEAEKNWKKLP